jgi:TRAP-type C4-dicarboxylate transport system permease small subunit
MAAKTLNAGAPAAAMCQSHGPHVQYALDGGLHGAQNLRVNQPDTLQPAPLLPPAPASRWFSLPAFEKLLGLVFCGVVLLNFCSAVARYAGTTMFIGADEVQVYTTIWLIFLGAAVAGRRNMHLRMDLLALRLSPAAARWRNLADAGLTVVVCTAMAWLSLAFTREMLAMGQRSDAAGIPMWLVHAAPVAGFLGLALAAAIEFARTWRK